MKVGEEVKPHPDLKVLYYSYLLIPAAIVFGLVIIPSIIASFLYLRLVYAILVTFSLLTPFFLVVGFVAFWIRRYYSSISYLFTEDEIIAERGVWWKRKSVVPYNRITNIDVIQGPLSRRFGLGTVRVQTAGYSGTGGAGRVAELSILGVKNFEEVRDFITSLVKGIKPVAVEAEVKPITLRDLILQILAELRRIREVVEKEGT